MPFFRGLALGEGRPFLDCVPREMGARAAQGELLAGLLPLVDYFRLQETYERLGAFGVAVRGRARSALLFSRRPLRQLDGATIAVSEETSTTACLLRAVLEQRYHLTPARYRRGRHPEAEALLLIGDEAIRFQQANRQYPFEVDLAFEWWLWQHLPFVFAVWVVRKDASPQDRRQIEVGVARALALNLGQLDAIARESAAAFGLTVEEITVYLESFVYRLGRAEEEGLRQFQRLVDEHHLLRSD